MSSENWCTIESDPGVFTELLELIGVKDCQVEELYSMDTASFEALTNVYGLIFLFKWRGDETDTRPIDPNSDVFFANQMINNACATQAILSILLNRNEIEIGQELRQFKEFTRDFPPEVKGLAISNSDLIRRAHNTFARPEPFLFVESENTSDKEDVYHFISYLPHKGFLYELDGLKRGPINLGECTEENWLKEVCPVIQSRIERYSQSEIRFNLMAIIKSRLSILQSRLEELEKQKTEVLDTIKELEGNKEDQDAMEVEGGEVAASTVMELKKTIEVVEEQLAECTKQIGAEEEVHRNWKKENMRRKHNYIPFIMNMLKILAEKGELCALINKAKEKEGQGGKKKQSETK